MGNFEGEHDLITLLQTEPFGGLSYAFETYSARLHQAVRLRLNRRICGRLDESDVLQEVFLAAVRELPGYLADPGVPVFVWLYQLTKRQVSDAHRKHIMADRRSVYRESISLNELRSGDFSGSTQAMTEILISQMKSPSSNAIRAERQRHILAGLQQMDEMDREVLLLRHFELLSNNDTAAILEISTSAASNRYVRALQRLTSIVKRASEINECQ